jgi:hypothetical protein
MASLVEQIMLQSQAGSANGAGFGDYFFKGKQLSQNQQQLDMQKQELAANLAMMPLKQTLMQQDAKLNEIKLTDYLEQRDAVLKNESAFQETTNLVAQALSSENQEDAEAYVWDAVSRNRGLWRHPGVKTLLEDARASLAGKLQIQQLRNQTADTYTPSIEVVTNPLNGEKVSVLKTSNRSGQKLDSGITDNAQSTLGKLMADRQRAVQTGDTNAVQAFDKEIAIRGQPKGMSITTNPDGTMTMTQGALTAPNLTRTQAELSDNLALLDTADRLLPLIDNETVGAQAFAESWIKDRILAQAYPELASKKRANAEVLAAEVRARTIKTLRSDSNISEPERKAILNATPEINSPIQSAAQARDLISASRKVAAISTVVKATKLGVGIPKAAALVLDANELARLVKQGVISREQAIAAFKARTE